MKKLLTLLTAFLILLSSCSTGMSPIDTVTASEPIIETTEEIISTFLLDSRYEILRDDDSTDAVDAAKYVRKAILALTGETLTFTTDWVKRGDPVVPGKFEILVGETNRSESAELFSTLKRGDWEYRANEGQIIICGGGAESTLQAAKAFCAEVLGYTEGDEYLQKTSIEITRGATRHYTHTYPITAVSLNGRPITDYVLALPSLNKANLEVASTFNDLLSENAGFQLSAKSQEDLEDGELYIELGQKRNDLPAYTYSISNDNGILRFSGDTTVLHDAVDRYLKEQLAAGKGEIVLSLPDQALKGYGGQQNGLVLKKETKETVSDGVEYRLLNYVDRDGKPVNAYVLVVEPGKAQIINGTPNGGTELYNVKATTVDAAKAAETQGYRVLAGVNADFFRISSDYSPQGPCIKNGVVIYADTSRPYFGVTKDGTFIIDEASSLKNTSSELLEAVGGRYIILKNGEMHQVGYGEEFAYTRHPRTAVGYDKDGRLYLLVVDGRQPTISNGASLTDLAIIFLQLGATDALNLDGGGSSTFILENGNSFKTMNSPSDGSLRKVYNSLLVVLK